MGRFDDAPEIQLYLLRHAHAGSQENWQGPDSERPLSAKGRRQAELLGAFLAERAFSPDAIVTSPKVRARQTADLVADAIGIAVSVDDRLAGPLELDEVSDICAKAGGDSVVLVGHDPELSEICGQLLGIASLEMKKGAFARFDVALPLVRGAARLRWLLPPDLVVDRL